MSEHDAVPDIAAGWITTTIEALGRLHCGQSPPSTKVNTIGTGTAYVSGPEQWDGYTVHQNKWTTAATRIAPANSIFITVKGAGVGTLFPGVHAAIGRDIYAFEPHESIDFDFVHRALQYSIQEVIAKARGDIPGLSKNHILDHQISVPGVATQHRVASKIDELFSRIEEGERVLERVQKLVERYRQSVLKAAVTGELTRAWREQHKGKLESGEALLQRILEARREAWEKAELAKMKAKGQKLANDHWKQKYKEPSPPDTTDLAELPEGWVWATLDQLCAVFGNGLSRKPENQPPGEPILRISAVRPLRVDLLDVRFYVPTKHESLEAFYAQSGDLLFTRYNGSRELVGVSGVVTGSERVLHPDKLIKARIASPALVKPDYLAIATNSGLSWRHITSCVKTSAGQHGVAGSDIKRTPVPVPPPAEQVCIADLFAKVATRCDEAMSVCASENRRSQGLRQAILKAAFSGLLVKQHSADEPASILLERIAAERGAITTASKNGRKKKSP